MARVILEITKTPDELARIIKTLRFLAYQQRYPHDEEDISYCAKVFGDIAKELIPAEEPEELCPICSKPSPEGYPHQECLEKGGSLNPDIIGVNEDGEDT